MSNENFPLVFRPAQIQAFIDQSKEASCFTGPDNETYIDSHIELVLEEVQAHEADLSAARVSIETYLIESINKEPDNPNFLRMREAFRPIIEEVKQRASRGTNTKDRTIRNHACHDYHSFKGLPSHLLGGRDFF